MGDDGTCWGCLDLGVPGASRGRKERELKRFDLPLRSFAAGPRAVRSLPKNASGESEKF